MHILVDVRTSCPSDIPWLLYGHHWAQLWKKYHPHDQITFLAYVWDEILGFPSVFIKRGWQIFWHKKLAHHGYWPDRSISFSRLPDFDRSVPSIRHIADLSKLIYPEDPLSPMQYRWQERREREMLRHARHIIIPHTDLMAEIHELLHVDERKVSILPYLMPEKKEEHTSVILPHGIVGEYLIAEATNSEEWSPTLLFHIFDQYRRSTGDRRKLIIIGDVSKIMGTLSTLIRSLELTEIVKIVGSLTVTEREHFYRMASGWWYLGRYYSRGPSIALAGGYDLPLVLSDIPWLRGYGGISVHPNHVSEILDSLGELLPFSSQNEKVDNESIIEAYNRILHQ